MDAGPNLSRIGALIGDPGRANILTALMAGRALTATELAYVAGVSCQTTSSHLAKLTEARILVLEKQGRHRYYRLAGAAVANALEALMVIAADNQRRRPYIRPEERAVRQARMCYDHLAGRLGVSITSAMVEHDYLLPESHEFKLTTSGEAFLRKLGVDIDLAKGRRRAFARQCLDWSERQPHLAGSVGAALADQCLKLKWIHRIPNGRAIRVTHKGYRELKDHFLLSFLER